MIGWMLLLLVLATASGPAGTRGEASVQIGAGVSITPVGGWTSAADVWKVGPSAVSLQKAGALVAFAAEAYGRTRQDLLAEESKNLENEFRSYRALPAASKTIATDVPALVVLFSGAADSGRLEGELVAAVRGGIGVLMLAVAPAGQLARVQGDLDRMLGTMVVPR
jgi:hypothetical protein